MLLHSSNHFAYFSPSFWIAFPLKFRLAEGSFSTITCHMYTVLGENGITHCTSQLTVLLTDSPLFGNNAA